MAKASKDKIESFNFKDLVAGAPSKGEISYFDHLYKELKKTSNTKQAVFGGVSGWFTGYLFMKAGKALAVATGGTILCIYFAQSKGYLKINWSKVNKDIEKVTEKIGGEENQNPLADSFDKVIKFSKKNGYLTGGYVGGFLIGMGTA
ncbi:FUN14 domain-containing protein 1B-like isoform X2 [Artemia franciscana]|uniref:FUN14 domain-containing protein 1 n=1 Tax=Artemia franciscana TaxID=6661 RepID=A0AA88H899_ARTSF|nr:hypothetical protein QYM36_017696 [Artemia franciscana]